MSGRVQRFQIGDTVEAVRGGVERCRGRIYFVQHDPVDDVNFAHCSGNSAKYKITGYDGWLYDWQLERPCIA